MPHDDSCSCRHSTFCHFETMLGFTGLQFQSPDHAPFSQLIFMARRPPRLHRFRPSGGEFSAIKQPYEEGI
jgi:hypothetical protein